MKSQQPANKTSKEAAASGWMVVAWGSTWGPGTSQTLSDKTQKADVSLTC